MRHDFERDLETLPFAYREPARRLMAHGITPLDQAFFHLLIGDAEEAIVLDRTGKLRSLLLYLRKHMPPHYWGSPLKVKAWAILGGYRTLDVVHDVELSA